MLWTGFSDSVTGFCNVGMNFSALIKAWEFAHRHANRKVTV